MKYIFVFVLCFLLVNDLVKSADVDDAGNEDNNVIPPNNEDAVEVDSALVVREGDVCPDSKCPKSDRFDCALNMCDFKATQYYKEKKDLMTPCCMDPCTVGCPLKYAVRLDGQPAFSVNETMVYTKREDQSVLDLLLKKK
ncbi:uncharacterized protein [Mytilus edulis]|uniref:uncharacterized protein n=1 Tax=Mytilus edulis TaxID=6550 RepID=UPI0039EE2AEB